MNRQSAVPSKPILPEGFAPGRLGGSDPPSRISNEEFSSCVQRCIFNGVVPPIGGSPGHTTNNMMKTLVFATLLALSCQNLPAALQNAAARIYCESVYFVDGTEPNNEFKLLLSGVDQGANNELFPVDDTYTHHSYVYLEDQIFEDYIGGDLSLNIPDFVDVNKDGFHDFFDTSVAHSGTSSGTYTFPQFNSGTVSATWSRAAGTETGTVTLRLRQNNTTPWKTFTHTFLIFEYRGQVSYTPGSNTVSASIRVAQTGYPENVIGGPVQFTKSSSDRFNLLFTDALVWTNSSGFSLDLFEGEYYREETWPTNYYGWIEFLDGEPSDSQPDFTLWTLSIDDMNDTDKDGIPDFSDDLPAAPATPPALALRPLGSNFELKITGTTGRVHTVETTTNLAAGQWSVVTNVTLNASSQSVVLPMQNATSRFWRVYTK